MNTIEIVVGREAALGWRHWTHYQDETSAEQSGSMPNCLVEEIKEGLRDEVRSNIRKFGVA